MGLQTALLERRMNEDFDKLSHKLLTVSKPSDNPVLRQMSRVSQNAARGMQSTPTSPIKGNKTSLLIASVSTKGGPRSSRSQRENRKRANNKDAVKSSVGPTTISPSKPKAWKSLLGTPIKNEDGTSKSSVDNSDVIWKEQVSLVFCTLLSTCYLSANGVLRVKR